jgi:hypothetical protein
MNLTLRKINLIITKTIAKYFKVILVLVLLAIFGVGYYWFLRPEFAKIKQEVDLVEIQNYKRYLDDYLSELKELKVARRQLAEEVQDKLDKILPGEEDIAGLFVQMQALAEENGLTLGGIDIGEFKSGFEEGQSPDGEAESVVGIQKLSIAVSFSGNDYSALKNLLSAMEYNLRLFDIYNIAFGNVKDGPYVINLRTYYLPNK